jgi:TonB family protein
MNMRRQNGASEFFHAIRPFVLIAVLLFFSIWTNQAVIDFRMQEMQRSMADLSRSYNSTSALNMLARYEMIRQRGNMPEEDETALELRLKAMASEPQGKTSADSLRQPTWQEKGIAYLIKAVRFLLGKKERVYEIATETRRDLELAYFYERARKYQPAIAIYTKALEEGGLGDQVAATMHLHRGFCLSLLGDLAGAKRDFQAVQALVSGTDENQVALRMLEIVRGMEGELRLAQQQKLSPFDQAKRLFRLGSTIEAMNLFNQILGDSKAPSGQKLEVRYWFGRAQEEMGQDSDAVATYRSVISENPSSEVARMANRRLYVLGKYYQNDAELEKAALTQLQKYQDFRFIDALKSVESAKAKVTATRMSRRPLALDTGQSRLLSDSLEKVQVTETALASLRTVDTAKEQASLKASLRKLPEPKRMATRIKADPLRREAIFGTIESNRGELEFLFQKWLRKGESFEGRLTVRILIAPDGSVREAKAVAEKSSITQPAFTADILQNVKRWRFRGDPGESADIPVSFPLDFKSRE